MMIEAIELSKRYDNGLLALDNLNLEVRPGEIYCLLGANGAGKSTTINLMLNFIEPTSGTARIHGVDVVRDPLSAKKHVAYLSENVVLYGNFTARQNLDFFTSLAGKRCDSAGYDEILARAGLPERAFDQRVREFSKGMRQKVAIAIVLAREADAVIMDEPTSGLDPQAAAEFVALIKSLRDEKRAVFMSTHDIFRASSLADRLGIMKAGRLVLELTRDAIEHQNLERLYLDYVYGTEGNGNSEEELPGTVAASD